MKTRTDSTPLSIKTKVARAGNDSLFEFAEEEGIVTPEQSCYTTIEYSDFDNEDPDSEPALKKQKTYQKPIRTAKVSGKQDDDSIRTIEYTLFNEDTIEVAPTAEEQTAQFVEYHEAESAERSMNKFKRRSKGFGKYIRQVFSFSKFSRFCYGLSAYSLT